MRKDNIDKVDHIVGVLLEKLKQRDINSDSIEMISRTILILEKAKAAGSPKVMNWGTVKINDASDGGEINTYNSQEEDE